MAPKVIRFIQDYIAQHQGDINSVARQLGVAPTAMAAAISEEMSHVYSEGAHRAVVRNQPDAVLDYNVQRQSDADIRADFESRRADIENGTKPSMVSKWYPTANDIGPANLNLGSSILTLQRYLANPANVADPLNLKQYANDYQKFARDIIDLNSPTTDVDANEGQA